jgi:hypothetical protein
VAKDKKKSKKKDKKNGSSASSAVSSLKTLSQNPLVADVVAAALVATAAALKDSNKARKLAEDAGDEVTALSKAGADRGGALWKLAVDVGRSALEAFNEDSPARKRADTARKPKRKTGAPKPD